MDSYSYHEFDAIKLEKQKALQRYNTFKNITNIFRTIEILIAISFIFYTISLSSSYLPAIIEISGNFLRRVYSLLFSPHFVFFIGNAIVITLFAKSKNAVTSENSGDDEMFREATDSIAVVSAAVENIPAVAKTPEVAKILEVAKTPAVVKEREFAEKSYRRTKSSTEMVVVKAEAAEKKELRRSVTEVLRDEESPEVMENCRQKKSRVDEEDELSNEEFRKKVEAFIEKQQRLLMEEKLAVIISN